VADDPILPDCSPQIAFGHVEVLYRGARVE